MLLNPFPLGTYRITQRFPERPEYYKKYNLKGHGGIDYAPIKNAAGKPVSDRTVYAPHDGYVQVTANSPSYGNFVTILQMPRTNDGIGFRSDLAHLESFLVANNQFVAMGDPIGIMGNTGDSTAMHTHWTIKKHRNGVTLNKDNGFNGAIDIEKYVLPWEKKSI